MKVKVNRAGKIYIALTIFLGIAAVNTANNLLYMVVSVLLGVMLTSGIISYLNLLGIKIYLKPPKEVYAGKKESFKIFAYKENKLPSFLIEASNKVSKFLFVSLSKKVSEGKLEFLFEKRGFYESVEIEVSSDFPLGFFKRFYTVEVSLNLVVFPKPVKTSLAEILANKSNDSSGMKFYKKGFEEVKDIREYSGEPLKLIHWKVSAKTEKLMVKSMLSQEESSIVLSLEDVSGDLETKLSKLVYLINELMRKGYSVGLKVKNKVIPPARGEKHRLYLLKELALY